MIRGEWEDVDFTHTEAHYTASDKPCTYHRMKLDRTQAWPPHWLTLTKWWNEAGQHVLHVEKDGIAPRLIGKCIPLEGRAGHYIGLIHERGRSGLVIIAMDIERHDNMVVVYYFCEMGEYWSEALKQSFASEFLKRNRPKCVVRTKGINT